MTLASGARFGSYDVLSTLGTGGMGEVYRARDTRLGREVALKILPASVDREARLLAALTHPRIATLHALEQIEGRPVLVMELVSGEDLSQRIDRGPVPVPETLTIAIQIALALEAAHEKGIVHRDLKPANIKLTDDGEVKVLDFGLAKAFGSDDPGSPGAMNSPTLTAPPTAGGVILGTAAYMSPEQARGRAADKRADIAGGNQFQQSQFGDYLWAFKLGGTVAALPNPRAPGPIPLPTEVAVAPAILETYVGTYAGDALTITLTLENGQLVGQLKGQKIPVPALSETAFFVGANLRLEFVKDAGGAVTHLLFRPNNGPEIKLVKKETPLP